MTSPEGPVYEEIDKLRVDVVMATLDLPGGSDILVRSFISALGDVLVEHHVLTVLASIPPTASRISSVGQAVRFLAFLEFLRTDERVNPSGLETVLRAERTVLDRFPGSGDPGTREILTVMEA